MQDGFKEETPKRKWEITGTTEPQDKPRPSKE